MNCYVMVFFLCFQAIEGLRMDDKLRPPKFDFDSEEVRYNHRFAPFGNVGTPPPVPYNQFQVGAGHTWFEHSTLFIIWFEV